MFLKKLPEILNKRDAYVCDIIYYLHDKDPTNNHFYTDLSTKTCKAINTEKM